MTGTHLGSRAMFAVWKTVGPILLLQLLIAFIYLGWPFLRRIVQACGTLIARYVPEPEPDPRFEGKTEQPYRGKWREAAYTRQNEREGAHKTRSPPSQATSARDDFLQTLGLSGSVSKAELKRRYRKLAKIYHPDQFTAAHHTAVARKEAAEKMLAINEAYDWLVANPRF
ncbi:MAG: DnaJ domain-containing protein [Henriciella sp.]